MKILHNAHGWINNEAAVEGEQYLKARGGKLVDGVLTGHGGHTEFYTEITPIVTPIRKISTGAMQRRFTIPEEVFITSDAAATVIKSRLLNAGHADLDFQDTIDGVTYICGVLFAGGVITDAEARITELLADGTEDESYP